MPSKSAIFLENVNNKINIVTYSFFFLPIQTIFTVLINIIKLTRKPTNFYQADFCKRLMCLKYLHHRTTSQVQKKFQEESSVTEAKQLLGNLAYDGNKIFAIRRCGRTQGQKNPPSLIWMTPKLVNWFVFHVGKAIKILLYFYIYVYIHHWRKYTQSQLWATTPNSCSDVQCSDFISAIAFVSHHVYLNQNSAQVITWM